ncbi:integrase catalytic domain-containing protein [Trichonephila clavipes]|nr:integrase catalytic domain-containing protein [Trichonephila clavipes]
MYGHMANWQGCPCYPKPPKSATTHKNKNTFTNIFNSIVRPYTTYAQGRVVVYRASTPQVLGSINGLGKVDSAFHPHYIGRKLTTQRVKCNKGRGTKSTNGYIALFVCLATKAVHIEAVGDLTTDSFIAALCSFSARRGAPRHIYSDNGTNFVGVCRKLVEIRKLWLSLPTNEAISYYLSKSSIDWHFIPPSSSHFGGIWESGIRSVKFHLKRVLGETILTFKDSKGTSFNLQPQRSLGVATEYQTWLLEAVELRLPVFLTTSKEMAGRTKLKEDDILLIQEEGPPGTWAMSRVLHPGKDGLVRVATVKTQDSVFKRPVHKLRKLPIYPN